MRNKLLHLLMKCFQVTLKIKSNRVYFISFKGNSYSDNPRAISEKLYQLYGNKLEYVWAVNKLSTCFQIPQYIKVVKPDSLLSIYYMCTSRVWVSNFCFPSWTVKSNNQYYIQTWHGDIAIKKILLDNKKRKYLFESDNIDLFLVGSDFGKKVMSSAFGYSGEFFTDGCPRNDIFFNHSNDAIKGKIRRMYDISEQTKVLLYAPTYRKKYKTAQQRINLNLETVKQILERETNCKWKILLRSHSENANLGFDYNNPSFVNVTEYPEMNELLLITDLLVSDYSSCVADFALLGKMIILYQNDLNEYTTGDRSLYDSFYDSPFYRFVDPLELYDFLKRINGVDSKKNCQDILNYYGSSETGVSSKKVAEKIKGMIDRQ